MHSCRCSGSTAIRDSKLTLKIIRITLGVLCTIAGVIGLLLPVVPQTIFFVLAVVLLFPEHHRVQSILRKYGPRYPRLMKMLERLGIDPGPAGAGQPPDPADGFLVGANPLVQEYRSEETRDRSAEAPAAETRRP